MYIYVSNETTNIDVFFDNLQVTHVRGPLVEETHYYPFGLPMSGVSSKTLSFGSPANKDQKFQSQKFDDDMGINYYEFKWRSHDPQIGRFIQVDPLCDSFYYNSTYAFSENKVTSHVELEGLETVYATTAMALRRDGITSNTAEKIVRKVNNTIKAASAVSADILTIAAGVTVLIASAGTATPFFFGLSASAAITGGALKLGFDINGSSEASSQIPTTVFGGLSVALNEATGKKIISDDLRAVLEFGEGAYTLKIIGLDKIGDAEKIANVLGGATLTLSGLSPETQKAIQELVSKIELNNSSDNNTERAKIDHTSHRINPIIYNP